MPNTIKIRNDKQTSDFLKRSLGLPITDEQINKAVDALKEAKAEYPETNFVI